MCQIRFQMPFSAVAENFIALCFPHAKGNLFNSSRLNISLSDILKLEVDSNNFYDFITVTALDFNCHFYGGIWNRLLLNLLTSGPRIEKIMGKIFALRAISWSEVVMIFWSFCLIKYQLQKGCHNTVIWISFLKVLFCYCCLFM